MNAFRQDEPGCDRTNSHLGELPVVCQRIGLFIALYLLIGGIISLLGWILDIPLLTNWDGTGISILPNTAVCAIFSGAAILALSFGRPRLAFWAVLPVAFIAFCTAFGMIARVSLIDSWLLFGREWGQTGTVVPGRMGLPALTSWSMISLALLLICARNRFSRAVTWISFVPLLISTISLTGYMYQAEAFYSIPQYTVIALQTASFVFAASVGLFALAYDRDPMRTFLREDSSGVLARRVAPWILATPFVVGWLRVMGERQLLYGSDFGSSLRTVIEAFLLLGLVCWGIRIIGEKEQALNHALVAERELKDKCAAEEAFAKGVLGSLPGAFVVLDNDWRFTYVNKHFAARMSTREGELLGRNVWEVFPDAVGNEAYCMMHKAVEERIDVEYEVYYAPLKAYFRDSVHVTETGLAMYSTDITELKKQERLLQESDHRKDVFLATLAHELRNPLTPLRFSVDLLQRTNDEAVMAEARTAMDRQLTHLVRLIDDLLDVSRIKQGKIRLQMRRVQLQGIVSAAAADCSHLIDLAGHRFHLDVASDPLYVDGDEIRLTQVVVNLLRNACKYTPQHGSITLTLRREGGVALVSVKDNGVGIPDDCLEEIFEPFAQVDKTIGRSEGGLGVGLMLSQQLVSLHGGTLSAQSEGIGKGSEFTIHLLAADAPAQTAEVSPILSDNKLDCRILVVDDNHDIARCLLLLLEDSGCVVSTAHSGEDAIALAEEFSPDVILLDIGLPDMTGHEVCTRIRSKPGGDAAAIIALTGWGGDEDMLNSKLAGFDAHVLKPIDLNALLNLLKGHIKGRV